MRSIKRTAQSPWRQVAVAAAAALLVSAGWLTATVQSQGQDRQDTRKGPGFGVGVKKAPIPWTGKRTTTPVAKNMKLVGWTDMRGHPDGEQVTGQVINGRDYIILGHYWGQGVSIVDVTDPTKPEEVSFIACEDPFCKATKVQVSGTTLMVPMRQTQEIDGDRPILPRHGAMFYDISDPRNPKQLSYFRTADRDERIPDGSHYSQFTSHSKYAYLTAPVSGYKGLIYMIVDVSDPKNPKEAGRWWWPGQHVAGGEKPQPGFENYWVHGAQANGDDTLGFAATLSDPPGGIVFLDIKDKAHPKVLSRLDLSPPMVDGYFGTHNVVLMESRKILVTMNEGAGNSLERPQMTGWVVDYADPTKPTILSILPIPQGHDRTKPVRFGPHNAHENQPQGMVDDYMLYISWFNAGVRVFDVSDAKHPEEVGFYEPPDPKVRIDARTWSGKPGDPNGSELMSLNHVFVDKRGYIYVSGYNDGLFVFEYTGPRPEGSTKALAEARKQHEALVAKK